MARKPSPAEILAMSKPQRANGTESSIKPMWECGLAKIRRELGLSQQDVADGSGINHVTISHVESGQDTRLSTAQKLAEFFGRSIDELWKRVDDGK